MITITKLAAPRRYVITFTVEGNTTFPLDMLRYDQCFPVNEAETHRMYSEERGRRRITLRTFQPDKNWKPTAGRWASFLWSIVEGL